MKLLGHTRSLQFYVAVFRLNVRLGLRCGVPLCMFDSTRCRKFHMIRPWTVGISVPMN